MAPGKWEKLSATGVAKYQFDATGKYQIALAVGDEVEISEFSSGWYKGVVNGKKGIFPANYIDLKDSDVDAVGGNGESTAADALGPGMGATSDSQLYDEVDSVLREWSALLKVEMASGRWGEYHKVCDRISTLGEWRRLLQTDIKDAKLRDDVRQAVIKLIEASGKMKEGFMVPRNEGGKIADDTNTPLMDLYRLHKEMQLSLETSANLPSNILEAGPLERRIEAMHRANRKGGGVRTNRQSNAAMMGAAATTNKGPGLHKSTRNLPSGSDFGLSNEMRRKARASLMEGEHQLFLEFSLAMISVGEPLELYFSIWSPQGGNEGEGLFVTEEFLVSLTENGMPEDITLMGKLKSIFTQLAADDLAQRLYLVCRIFRCGVLVPKDVKGGGSIAAGATSSSGDARYRRPFGCAVLPLWDRWDRLTGTEEYSAAIYTPPAGKVEELSPLLHRLIAANEGGAGSEYEPAPRANGVVFKLTLLKGKMAALTKGDDQEQKKLSEEIKGVSLTPKLYFGKLIEPTDVRNDMYVTLVSGRYSQDRKRTAKNIEVRMFMVLDSGEFLPALVRGTGPQNEPAGEYRSTVYYHNNSPNFGETIRVCIPAGEKFERSHLLFLFFHASTTASKTHPFAFSFLKLTTETGFVVEDMTHELECYKPLKEMDKISNNLKSSVLRPTYMLNPEKLSVRPKESCTVATRLCSTQKTQKAELYSLLHWRHLSDDDLIKVLEKITYLQESEIVKFLRQIFDVLVLLMAEKRGFEVLRSVWRLFVSILSILTGHYSSFRPVLDAYITDIFTQNKKAKCVYRVLLAQVKRLFVWLDLPDIQNHAQDIERRILTNAMKCFTYVMRFVVFSRLEDEKSGDPECSREEFQDELLEVMYYVDAMMTKKEPTWVLAIQTHTLKHIASAFDDLGKVFSVKEIGEVARGYLESVQPGKQNVNLGKLTLMYDLVTSDVVGRRESRGQVMAALIRGLQFHLNKTPEERIVCVAVLKELLRILQTTGGSSKRPVARDDDVWNVSILLPDMVRALQSLLNRRPTLTWRKGSAKLEAVTTASVQSSNVVEESSIQQITTATRLPEAVVKNVDPIADLMTSMLTILHLMNQQQMDYYLSAVVVDDEAALSTEAEEGDDHGSSVMSRKEFMLTCLKVCHAVLMQGRRLYPDVWLLMRLFSYMNTVKLLRWFSRPLCESYNGPNAERDILPPADRSSKRASANVAGTRRSSRTNAGASLVPGSLWRSVFELGFEILRLPELDLDRGEASRRKFVKERFGDVRMDVCDILRNCWVALGKNQGLLTQDLVGPVIELSVSGCDGIEVFGRELYFDLIKLEYAKSSSFQQVERLTFQKVHHIVYQQSMATSGSSAEGGEEEEEAQGSSVSTLFTVHLLSKFKNDAVLSEAKPMEFLNEVNLLFELLNALSRFPDTPEYEDDRVVAMLQLMAYLKKTKRYDMYSTKIGDMCKLHVTYSNFAEAARTTLLLSDIVDWDGHPIVDDAESSRTPEELGVFETKEQLLNKAAKWFTEGENWEEAIGLLEQLRNRYERVVYDYTQLADVLRREAELFDKIITTERFFPPFFRVGYYGLGYPIEYRNKVFVYRGNQLESLMDFSSRIKLRHPKAETLFPGKPVKDEHRSSPEGRFLQISSVTPAQVSEVREQNRRLGADDDDAAAECDALNPAMPARVAGYIKNNNVQWFSAVRPFRKREKKSANEFLDAWVCKSYYRTEDSLPTTHRRSEVVQSIEVTLNPLECSVTSVQEKNAELEEVCAKNKLLISKGRVADQSFTMLMNGVVDASVSGGAANFEMFLNGEYKTSYPEIYEDVTAKAMANGGASPDSLVEDLRAELRRQVELLDESLETHGQVCAESVLPLHEFLLGRFKELCALMEQLGVSRS